MPDAVRRLEAVEQGALVNHLKKDAGEANGYLLENSGLSCQQVYYVFIDYRIYLYVLAYTCVSAVNKYLRGYLPSLLLTHMGYHQSTVHLMIIPPYAFACIFCLLVGYSSSRWNDHGYHIIFCLLVSLIGLILIVSLIGRGTVTIYTCICIALNRILSVFSLIVSWLTNNIYGQTKRAMTVGFLMDIGQIGGIIWPLVYTNNTLSNRRACFSCIGMVAVCLIVTLILRLCFVLENQRRDHLTSVQFESEAKIKEPCDWHPGLRYVL